MNREYDCELSKEENIANEIYETLNKNFGDLINDKSFLNEFHFELVNDFYNRNVFFSYVLKPHTNIKNVEICLMRIGINKRFVDKSNKDKKRYLAVWK